MPKLNGKQHLPKQQVSPEYQLTVKLLEAFRDTWVNKSNEQLADPVTFSRMSVVAMTQLAAIVGVDVGMTIDQFTAICRANFDEAHKKAPKFG